MLTFRALALRRSASSFEYPNLLHINNNQICWFKAKRIYENHQLFFEKKGWMDIVFHQKIDTPTLHCAHKALKISGYSKITNPRETIRRESVQFVVGEACF